jgi:hypothetical protein
MWDVDRRIQTQILPYPQGLQHPTREELDRISAHVHTLPSLVKNYMATGGRFGTFGQQQYVPGGSAAPAKRAAEQDGGDAVEPAAKRYHEGAYVQSERGFASGQPPRKEGEYRSSHIRTLDRRRGRRVVMEARHERSSPSSEEEIGELED